MAMTTQDRMRMFENRLRNFEARYMATWALLTSHVHTLEQHCPSSAQETFAMARRKLSAECADAVAEAGMLDALIDEIDQQLGLPANV